MPDPSAEPPADPLIKAARQPGPPSTLAPALGRSAAGLAVGLTVLWLALVALYKWVLPDAARQTLLPQDGVLAFVLGGLGILLPVALIWMATGALQTMAALRAEAAGLRAQIDQMKSAAARPARPAELRPAELRTAELRPAAKPAAPPARQPAKPARPPADAQTALALDQAPEAEPVPLQTAIRALHFPEDANDREGFRALRIALENRALAKLIRAAQDVLTLMSQEGIYVDDLRAEPTTPDLWRRFATGARGPEVTGLGAIKDDETLARIAARMRADTIFRDAAHHFVRQFDRSLGEFETVADDAEMTALAQTRSARAFMLIGRVMTIFD